MLCKLYAEARVCKLVTQKLCAVGMHNAIQRNNLKVLKDLLKILSESESFKDSQLFCLGSFEGHKRSLRILS